MYSQFLLPPLIAALLWVHPHQEPAPSTQEPTESTASSPRIAALPSMELWRAAIGVDFSHPICRPEDASLNDPDLQSKLDQWGGLADLLWEQACRTANDPRPDRGERMADLSRRSFEWHRSASLWSAVHHSDGEVTSSNPAASILEDCRQHDRRRNGVTAERLVEQYLTCLHSDCAEVAAVAYLLDEYYRNANIRITVSERLLDRLVDLSRWSIEQGRDGVLGIHPIRNQVVQRLELDLVPDSERWSLALTNSGKTNSIIPGMRDGAGLHTIEKSDLMPRTRWSNAASRTAQPIGGLADVVTLGSQSPAHSVSSASWTQRIEMSRTPAGLGTSFESVTRNRNRFRIQGRIDQAVEDAVRRARNEWERLVVERCVRWDLDPQPVEMRTTDNELILRFRLAGRDQLAADTPRPALGQEFAATFQLHHSAVNNILARLDIAGRQFSLPELVAHLREHFDPNLAAGYQPEGDIEVHFAPYDPIRVQFVDGTIEFELNLCRLQFGADKIWRNVTIQTRYDVDFDGFYMTLQQTGGVRASGSRVRARDEIALGAAFDRLFSDEYCLSLLPPSYAPSFERLNVQVSSVQLENGWLSITYQDHTMLLPFLEESRDTPGILGRAKDWTTGRLNRSTEPESTVRIGSLRQ